MDTEFTQDLKDWLDDENKDYALGAIYLLKLTGNRIMYANLSANPRKYASFIEEKIRKFYEFRLASLTHEQVLKMERKVERIVNTHISLSAEADKHSRGKRADHDSLPDEIKALYLENLDLLRKMRELHLQLRTLTQKGSTCPDSDRYPFLKELISLDKKLRGNWKKYDQYTAPVEDAQGLQD